MLLAPTFLSETKTSFKANVFLIDLFVSKSLDAIDTESITLGTTVNSDNRLVRCGEKNHSLNNRIYFLDQGKKRHIANPKA